MSRFRSVGLVAGREVREAFRRKTTRVVIAILFLGSTAAMVLPQLIHSDDTTRYKVAVVGTAPELTRELQALEPGLDATITITRVGTVGAARLQVQRGQVNVAIAPGDPARILVKADQYPRLVAASRQALATATISKRLEQQGLDGTRANELLATPDARLVPVDSGTSNRRAASFALSLLLYLLLLTLMVGVANGTALEKANRISEVLLAVVKPGALLFGKVLGVGFTGLCTLAAGLLPVLVKMVIGGDLPAGIGGAVLGTGAWFVVGLVLYLTLAASLGALVERQEEAGAVVMPLTGVLIGTFVVAQSSADTTLGTVLGYVPLTSPIMEPTRIALGVTSPTELIVSLLLLVATTVVTARVGATLYGRAIVRTGRRLKVRDLLGRPAG